MLRKDGEYTIYCIEEFQSKWSRWVRIEERYLKCHDISASGQCWQETGIHGFYDFNSAAKHCNALNQALLEGIIKTDVAEVTKFRIVKCEFMQKQTPIEFNGYSV